jgi:hypothetical protein
VDAVFGRDLPGFGVRHVRASATATAATGPLASDTAPSLPAETALEPLRCA